MTFGRFPPRTLAYGQETTYTPIFGSYLAPGVHVVYISLYGGQGGPAIWLGNWR